MSIVVNDQVCSYVRSLFEHPSKLYESYQENGTKYLKLRKKLDDPLQQQLNACAGEIFLCGIPADCKPEKIAEVASILGEVYILRFKVHFSGASRGFAYLQYLDPSLMSFALQKLPLLFRMSHLPTIKVCTSRNTSKLLLRKTNIGSPLMVYEMLKNLINFNNLVGNEVSPGYFEYQIIFNCNEDAVHARREIMKSIMEFGRHAIVVWDTAGSNNDKWRSNQREGTRLYNKLNKKNQFESKSWNRLSQNNFYKNSQQQQQQEEQKVFTHDFVNDFRKMNLC